MTQTERAWALTTHGFRQTLQGRRLIGAILVCLVPVGLAIAAQQGGDVPASEMDPLFFVVGLGLVVPLIALLIGVSALREDLEEGTIVHLVTRPVRRETVLVTRLVGAAAAVILLAGVALTLPLVVLGGAVSGFWQLALTVSLLSGITYTALFALLGAVTKRAVLLGLLYLVAWEGVVASTPLFFSKLTVAYWARAIVANNAPEGSTVAQDLISGAIPGTGASILVLVLVTLVATVAGAAWFGQREFAGAEPEE